MKNTTFFSSIILSLCLVMISGPASSSQAVPITTSSPALRSAGEAVPSRLASNAQFGRMPLYFIPNQGQLDDRVFYYVQGQNKTLYFGSEGLTFLLSEPAGPDAPGRRWVLKLDFVGANPGLIPEGLDETGAVISYFKGPKEEWKTGLPTYFKVAYREVWPGIDLVYSGHSHELKHEFAVKPGADPSLIRLGYRGAASVRVNGSGELEVESPLSGFKDAKPVAWQEIDGRRREVSLAYRLEPPSTGDPVRGPVVYGFQVGDYDPARPLILDPATFVYCGYIGGSGTERGHAIAVDGSESAYVVGYTNSSETTFPVTVGPDLTQNSNWDAFVARVKSDGTGLVYCGFIGGSGNDYGRGVAVDGSGNAYVTGYTNSSAATFPVTVGPILTQSGDYDAFVAKVASGGTGLVYCGFIGGSSFDSATAIAVDGSGNSYITGNTRSDQITFPDVYGPDLGYNGGWGDAYVAKIRADGTGLAYCGYIGGSSEDICYAIDVDGSGSAYVAGRTTSDHATFPETVGPDLTFNGGYDAFVAKVQPSGAGLVYCGYIGGSDSESAQGIAVDGSGYAYVTGWTYSSQTTFPVSVGPDLTYNGGDTDAFVAKVKIDGTGLVYCGYIGGGGHDSGEDIAADGLANAYVSGYTNSSQTTFPVSVGPDLTYNGGDSDAFVAKVRSDGSGLNYCGYIGGSFEEDAAGIAVDGSGNAYVTGETDSGESTFPETVGPDLTSNGGSDAFVAKISPPEADISVAKSVDNISPVLNDTINFTVTAENLGPDNATGVRVEDRLPAGLGYVSASASQGSYVVTTGLWTVGKLANGSSASLTLRARVDTKGTMTNTATVAGVYENDPDPDNDIASVTVSSQYQVYPPSNVRLSRLQNDLIFFMEYVNRLSWGPNPLNLQVIVNYRLYRKAKAQPSSSFALFRELDASATGFDDRGLKKDELFTYRVTSVSSTGLESQAVEVGN
jgi:uncharacterized repeat protein (TIGR01451 family)